MTVDAGERADEHAAGMGGVSGSVVNALVELTRDRTGPGGVAQVLALADERRDFARLGDRHRWSSLAQAVALFNAASLVNEDGAVALHVGERLLAATDELDDRLGDVERPGQAFARLKDVLAVFDGTAVAAAVEAGDDHALIRVTPRAGVPRHAHLCEMTRGLLASLPTAFGLHPALVTESECAARGGRFCLYAVSWDSNGGDPEAVTHLEEARARTPAAPPPEPAPVAADTPAAEPATAEPDEGRTWTSDDGEPADDVATLEAIAARADEAAGDTPYVLGLRTGPDTARHLRWRGLDGASARSLAEELWASGPSGPSIDGTPGTTHPSTEVVDIASERARYGWIAARLPAGRQPDTGLVRALHLFADYAAAALDIDAVRADARREGDRARALLAFSEALSRMTDLDQAVQLVVDTVPGVTGSDRATVYLWNDRLGHLVPRARTSGRDDDGSFTGVFAVTGGSRPATPPLGAAPDAGPVTGRHPLDASDGPHGNAGTTEGEDGPEVVSIPANAGLVDSLVARRQVIVVERETGDPALRRLLADNGSEASVIAPLFAAGQFLGTLSASFDRGTPAAAYRDPDVAERLSGFADQAATALQNLDLLEKVSHLAWHDALTGLPNRRLFKDRVDQELIRSRRVGEPVCLFFVDLDHFKHVNDTLGHAAGDELIQRVGERLVDTVRSQDTVARVGGDEFAVLLPGLADQLDIDQLASRMLEAVAEPLDLSEEPVRTTASIGIAVAPEHGDTYDELLSRADEAMYRAKGHGRNRFQMFSAPGADDGGDEVELDPRALYRDLVHALGSEEFFVVYQPYVDLRTTEVLGVEALLRWRHPIHGVLEAPLFVPMAERSDAIVALDTFVLEQSCAQLRRWEEAGLPAVSLSVNISSRDLDNPGYAGDVARVLSEFGIEPDRLELDVTERVVVEDDGTARANIDELRLLGVRFTVDDFGTPNSSLARLGAFPVSTLKIDQSFVQVLAPGGDSDDLVAAIVDMADRLGLECVAEGVETRAQSRVLLQRGCTTAQGYFLCPPLAADELEAALTVVGSPGADEGPDDLDP
jgi:diguanylate cyclase (GGDEF)-like protein